MEKRGNSNANKWRIRRAGIYAIEIGMGTGLEQFRLFVSGKPLRKKQEEWIDRGEREGEARERNVVSFRRRLAGVQSIEETSRSRSSDGRVKLAP